MFNPFDHYTIPLDKWVDMLVKGWLVPNFRPFFQGVKWPIAQTLDGVEAALQWMPPLAFLAILFLVAWRLTSWRTALFSVVGLAFIGYLGAWKLTMTTLALVATSVLFCALVGIPLGILASRSNTFEGVLRPILDAMQTVPPFVYLVPAVMLFSIGNVSGVIATIVFALPPIVRLTSLGIRQVQGDVVEAAYAFGATPRQVLWDVQFPLALRTIMAGLNQTLMLALSMVVIAAIIGARGLGDPVRAGLNNLDVGLAAVGGIGIVILAIILDRITQALGRPTSSEGRMQMRGIWDRLMALALLRRPVPSRQDAPTPSRQDAPTPSRQDAPTPSRQDANDGASPGARQGAASSLPENR